jgi:hypothetical protein
MVFACLLRRSGFWLISGRRHPIASRAAPAPLASPACRTSRAPRSGRASPAGRTSRAGLFELLASGLGRSARHGGRRISVREGPQLRVPLDQRAQHRYPSASSHEEDPGEPRPRRGRPQRIADERNGVSQARFVALAPADKVLELRPVHLHRRRFSQRRRRGRQLGRHHRPPRQFLFDVPRMSPDVESTLAFVRVLGRRQVVVQARRADFPDHPPGQPAIVVFAA